MLPFLVAVVMFAVIALYVIIVPMYFCSVDSKIVCKYEYAIEREKSKKAKKHGLGFLACSTALLLFISIAVELASR